MEDNAFVVTLTDVTDQPNVVKDVPIISMKYVVIC